MTRRPPWRSLSLLYFQWNPSANARTTKIHVMGNDRTNETMSMPTAVPGDIWGISETHMLISRRIPTAISENRPVSTLFTKIMQP